MSKGTALITGGSKGIGRALAAEFALAGYDLILVSRSAKALSEVAVAIKERYGVSVGYKVKDLSEPGAALDIYNELKNEPVNVLVNNAGFGLHGPFSELDYAEQIGMLRINIETLVALTRLWLPGLIEKNRGGVLNVASIAAFQPGPLMAVYYASKAFVLSFSEAIAQELATTNVTVSVLCPGPTKSLFFERSGFDNSRLVQKKLLKVMSCEQVAQAGVRGFLRGKRIIRPGFSNYLVSIISRFVPRNTATWVTYQLNKARSSGKKGTP